jgi:hypothetical protein
LTALTTGYNFSHDLPQRLVFDSNRFKHKKARMNLSIRLPGFSIFLLLFSKRFLIKRLVSAASFFLSAWQCHRRQ